MDAARASPCGSPCNGLRSRVLQPTYLSNLVSVDLFLPRRILLTTSNDQRQSIFKGRRRSLQRLKVPPAINQLTKTRQVS
ncbi:hypothetical protein YC2023_118181 [Brassica napus]